MMITQRLSRREAGQRRPVTGRICQGQLHCVAPLFRGISGTFYNWDLGFEAGFEVCTEQMPGDELVDNCKHLRVCVFVISFM